MLSAVAAFLFQLYKLGRSFTKCKSSANVAIQYRVCANPPSPRTSWLPAPQEVQELCSALVSNTTLKELSAGSHSISAQDAEAFANVLRRNSALKALCLGNSSFGDEGVAALAEGLAGEPFGYPVNFLRASVACKLCACMPLMGYACVQPTPRWRI